MNMLELFPEPVFLALMGGFGGLLLGLAARLGRFCTMGAIEDWLYGGSDTRMRMWLMAIAVATMLTFALVGIGAASIDRSVYVVVPWSPVCAILGGLAFGYGMALAGNCGFGALARAGGGDLRGFVIVLIVGISAYAALSGPLAGLRVWLTAATAAEPGSAAQMIAALAGVPVWLAGMLAGGVLAAVLLLTGGELRHQPATLAWAAVAGVAVASGWWATSHAAAYGFDPVPVISHTYAAPLGETLLFVMTSSGGGLSFGVGSVFGVLAGAFLGSLVKGHFRWEACEDPRELRRQMLGAVLMGVGAVFALGCTIGQGMSAFSVLAWSAPVVLVSIITGAAIGLRQLIVGLGPVDGEY